MLFDVDFTFFLKSLPEIFSAPTVIYRVYDHFLWVDPELKEDLLMPDLIHILASFSSAHLVRPSPDKSEIKKKTRLKMLFRFETIPRFKKFLLKNSSNWSEIWAALLKCQQTLTILFAFGETWRFFLLKLVGLTLTFPVISSIFACSFFRLWLGGSSEKSSFFSKGLVGAWKIEMYA